MSKTLDGLPYSEERILPRGTSLLLFLVLFLASCSTRDPGRRRHIDLGLGYQKINHTPAGEAEKTGPLFHLRYYKGTQTQFLGQYGWAIGIQETIQEGKTSTRNQVFNNRAGFFDLSYLLPAGNSTIQIGGIVRTFAGYGVEFDRNNKTNIQVVPYAGPQIQKDLGERFVMGVSLLRTLLLKERAIVQIPFFIGWKF
jgi:hypothetical protein